MSLVLIAATSEGGLKVDASEEKTAVAVNWLTKISMKNKCDKGCGLSELKVFCGINCCVL